MRVYAAQIAVERQTERVGCGLGYRQADAQDRVRAQFGFVGCAVECQQFHVNGFLVAGVPAEKASRQSAR